MKASLAIDVVVLIVLAAIVIIVGALFFKHTAARGGSRLDLQMERAELCKQYVMLYDSDCDGKVDPMKKQDGFGNLVNNKLVPTCKRLGGFRCDSASSSNTEELKTCIRDCCAEVCPQETTTTT